MHTTVSWALCPGLQSPGRLPRPWARLEPLLTARLTLPGEQGGAQGTHTPHTVPPGLFVSA